MLFLHDLFIATARKYSNKCALIWDTSEKISVITFEELLYESGVVIEELISAGADNEYIGILIETLLIYPAISIGILRSNCAYVFLDLKNPLSWNLHLIKKLNIRFLLTSSGYEFTDKWQVLKKISIHNESVHFMKNIESPHIKFKKCSNVLMAYAIQTSGTTGIPKIIQVPHQSIVPNILQLRSTFEITPDDTIFLSAPLTFDPSVVETYLALSSGASLLLAPHYIRAAPGPMLFRFLFQRLRNCGNISVLTVTPSYAACLFSNSSIRDILPDCGIKALRVLSLGGEPSPPISMILDWKKKLGGNFKTFSLYGITEVSCWASIVEIDSTFAVEVVKQTTSVLCDETLTLVQDSPQSISVRESKKIDENDGNVCIDGFNNSPNDSSLLVPSDISEIYLRNDTFSLDQNINSYDAINGIHLGLPMLQTLMEVRDSGGNIITEGEGELYVGSDTRVCLLDNEDINVAEKGNIVLRATGDIVKVIPSNDVSKRINPLMYYIGRRDGAVKRYGRWIHIKPIETVACSFVWKKGSMHSISIDTSTCVWFSDSSERKRLVLFVVPSSKIMFNESNSLKQNFVAELTSHLFNALPSNSWPDLILPIEELPLTRHAKVDKENLISQVKDALLESVPRRYDANLESCDEALINFKLLWIKYLNLSKEPTSGDQFLSSGGDSLLALRFISELEEILNYSMPPLLLTTLLKGTYSEACNCINANKTEYDAGEHVASLNRIVKNQGDGVVQFKKRSSESDSKFVKVKRSNVDDLLCLEYRRGGIKHHNSSEKYFSTLVHNTDAVTLILEWKHDMGKCIDASPVLLKYNRSQNVVVVGSHSHHLDALYAETGKTLSSCELPDRIESSVCSSVCGKFIFVGCYDYSMYCIHLKNGKVVWSFKTGNIIKSSPIIVRDGTAIVFGSYDEFLYCLETKNGKLIWKVKPGTGSIYSSPCLSAETLFGTSSSNVEVEKCCNSKRACERIIVVATLGGTCSAVLESDGRILWSFDIQAPVFSSPLLFNENVLFASVKGKLLSALANTGKMVWSFQAKGNIFSSFSLLEMDGRNNLIIFGCHDCSLYCLDTAGVLKWHTELDSPIFSIPFIFPVEFTRTAQNILSEDVPYKTYWVTATSTDGFIYLLDVYSGKIKGNHKIKNEIFSSPIVFQNLLIFGCRDNFLYCLKII